MVYFNLRSFLNSKCFVFQNFCKCIKGKGIVKVFISVFFWKKVTYIVLLLNNFLSRNVFKQLLTYIAVNLYLRIYLKILYI